MNPIFTIVISIIGVFVFITLCKNFLFLVLSAFYPVKESLRYIRALKKHKKEKKYEPKVSLIVPCWNEEVGVLTTVNSILENGYENIEIVVVNDGSTDRSDTIMKDFIKDNKVLADEKKLVYIYQENTGKGGALNKGLEYVTGEIIMTVDADSSLKKGSIKNLTRYYLDDRIMAAVGNVQVLNRKTLIGVAQYLEYHFGFYNKRAHAMLGAEYIFGGACASFRKSVFDKVGDFDEINKTEDIEMSMRVRAHGYACTYADDVVAYTEGASDLFGLINQRIRWKKGRFDTFYKYMSMFFSTNKDHNLFLSFIILPFSLLAEIQLLFEPIAIAVILTYTFITHEFVSLAIGISFIFIVYFFAGVCQRHANVQILFLAFFTWPLFFFIDWIELMSLIKSIKMYFAKEDVEWQRWNRVGIKL